MITIDHGVPSHTILFAVYHCHLSTSLIQTCYHLYNSEKRRTTMNTNKDLWAQCIPKYYKHYKLPTKAVITPCASLIFRCRDKRKFTKSVDPFPLPYRSRIITHPTIYSMRAQYNNVPTRLNNVPGVPLYQLSK